MTYDSATNVATLTPQSALSYGATYTVTVVNPLPVGTTSISNTVIPGTGICDPTCSPINPTGSVLATSKILLTDNGKPATPTTQVASNRPNAMRKPAVTFTPPLSELTLM